MPAELGSLSDKELQQRIRELENRAFELNHEEGAYRDIALLQQQYGVVHLTLIAFCLQSKSWTE